MIEAERPVYGSIGNVLLSVKREGMVMAYKAAIRAGALKTVGKGTGRGSIAAAESHAKREDPVAQSRHVRDSAPVGWCKAEGMTVSRVLKEGEPPQDVVCGPLDYLEAFKAHKRETGAGERKGAALAMEFKAIVSPDWLAEGGADPRDPNNPRVRQLVAEAQAWAESWGGKGAVWAVRYDTDEKGAGVVDLFMSPVRQQAHKNGKSKLVISCRKAKEELLAVEREQDAEIKTSGAAMQSSWARWCQQRLDARIERGASKEATGREHIHADVYAAEAEKAKTEARAELGEIAAEAARERQRAAQAASERQREEQATRAAQEAQRAAERAAEAAERRREEAERAAAEITSLAHRDAQTIRDNAHDYAKNWTENAIGQARYDADKILEQAKERAETEHIRLMGLAGTPEFRQEADLEVASNIRRVVQNWNVLKAEREKFNTMRDASLDERTQEILAENSALKKQVSNLMDSIRQLKRIRDIWQEAVEAVTTSDVASRVLDRVRSLWSKDTTNPDKAPSYRGPSGPGI